MHKLENRIFGRLTVLNRAPSRANKVYWVCWCTCGNTHTVQTNKLMSGNTKSCGCLAQELRGKPRITHGETRGHRSTWSPRTKMLYAAKARAKKDNLPFDLILDDIVIPDTCPILGLLLTKNSNKCQPNSPSLDKIEPLKGYVKGNIQVISHKANTMKSNASIEEIEKLLNYLKSR